MEMRASCVDCLHKLGDYRAVGPLIGMFDDPDNEPFSWEIIEALEQISGWISINSILEALHSGTRRIRVKIARMLLDYDDEKVLPELMKALNDPDTEVFIHVCEAIEAWSIYRSNRNSASAALSACLKDNDTVRRSAAARALGNAGNIEAACSIIGAIGDYPDDKSFNSVAAIALSKISEEYEDKELNQLIEKLLDSGNFSGREDFINHSCRNNAETEAEPEPEAEAESEVDTGKNKMDELHDPLIENSTDPPEPAPETIKILIDQLKDGKPERRIDAAIKLGDLKSRKATMNLCLVLSDSDLKVQLAVIKALRKICDKRATSALVLLLNQKTCCHREDVAGAIGNLMDRRAVPALIKAYRTAWLELRAEIVRSLGKIGGPAALDALITTLGDKHPKIRIISVYNLYDLQHKRALKALELAVHSEKHAEVKEQMAGAIKNYAFKQT